MQKRGFFAALCVLLGAGCQVFTAGDVVADPDPAQVRSAQAAQAKKKDVHTPPKGNPHANPHADPHGSHKAREGAAPTETATASHILIRYAGAMRSAPDVTRSKEEAQKLAKEIANKAQKPGSDFAQLANQHTEDPSGKGRGGSLGTFPRGRMVPEFDRATFELEPGGVSEVVETPFGFHIIHRDK
jgi:parvulin-like peptidyl-prolyl isomerase